MKIGNPPDKPGLAPVAGNRGNAAEAGAAKGKAATAADTASGSTVALSSAASSLMGVQASQAEFDTGKVERISDAISQGQFTVNAEVIADKLIANAKELLVRPH